MFSGKGSSKRKQGQAGFPQQSTSGQSTASYHTPTSQYHGASSNGFPSPSASSVNKGNGQRGLFGHNGMNSPHQYGSGASHTGSNVTSPQIGATYNPYGPMAMVKHSQTSPSSQSIVPYYLPIPQQQSYGASQQHALQQQSGYGPVLPAQMRKLNPVDESGSWYPDQSRPGYQGQNHTQAKPGTMGRGWFRPK